VKRRWLLAMVRLIRRGRKLQRKQLKLCGGCIYYDWWGMKCSLRGRCVFVSGGGGSLRTEKEEVDVRVNSPTRSPPVVVTRTDQALPERGASERYEVWMKRIAAQVKPKVLPEAWELAAKKKAAEKKEVSGQSSGGHIWSERFTEPLSEERRIILWNRHIAEKVREFATLLREDEWRRAVEEVLIAHGIDFNSDDVDNEDEQDEDEEVVAGEEQSIEEVVESLTKQLKEFTQDGYEANR